MFCAYIHRLNRSPLLKNIYFDIINLTIGKCAVQVKIRIVLMENCIKKQVLLSGSIDRFVKERRKSIYI